MRRLWARLVDAVRASRAAAAAHRERVDREDPDGALPELLQW